MDQTKPETPYVRQLPLGPMKNFVYLVGAPRGRQAFVIDPAWDAQAIHSALLADGRELVGIFLTHHHHDHINAVPELLRALDLPVYVQKAELDFATEALKPFAGAVRAVGPGDRVGRPRGRVPVPPHARGAVSLVQVRALHRRHRLRQRLWPLRLRRERPVEERQQRCEEVQGAMVALRTRHACPLRHAECVRAVHRDIDRHEAPHVLVPTVVPSAEVIAVFEAVENWAA